MIRLIAAIDRKRGIAKAGHIPWKIPEDEQFFTDQTKLYGGHVLSGATTYQTYHGPLAGRHNYILTHKLAPIEGVTLVHDLPAFLQSFRGRDLWVAGGAAVFDEVIKAGAADELYLTHVDGDFACDRFFPPYEDGFKLVDQSGPHKQNGLTFRYARYTKV